MGGVLPQDTRRISARSTAVAKILWPDDNATPLVMRAAK